MANEAVPVNGPYEVQDFTVAANTAIDKGTLCVLSGTRTAAASATTGAFAGVASNDKSVTDSDTSTVLGMNRTGIFTMRAGGGTAITEGELVSLSGINIVEGLAIEAVMQAGGVVGQSLGPAVALGTAATIEVDIGKTS